MGSSSSIPLDKRVVIVGGGYAGITLAAQLMKMDANVTLIDPKDSFCHNVASIRAVVEPDMAQKMYIDYETTFKGFFRKGCVVSIDTDAKEVVMEDGEKIKYDILVIATGCTGQFPAKLWDKSKEEAVAMYREYAEKVKSSQRIAIVGGGAVGVEIAAEIGTDYKDKQVTLFHPKDELLRPGLSNKLQNKLRAVLERLKVRLVLGEKVSNLSELGETGPFVLQTTNGESYEVDMVIPCLGLKVNTTAYAQGLAPHMEESGALKVTDTLQVDGQEDIFAMGDCINVEEPKIIPILENHVACILHNINARLKDTPMKKYKSDNIPFKMVVSLGRSSGTGELKNGIILPEFAVTKLKSKGMFVGKMWGTMGQKPPK